MKRQQPVPAQAYLPAQQYVPAQQAVPTRQAVPTQQAVLGRQPQPAPAPGPSSVPATPAAKKTFSDHRLAVLGGACLVLSLAGILLRTVHVLPKSAASSIVLAAVAIGLRVLLLFSARTASPAHRAKVLNLVSLAGLAISGLVLIIALPKITNAGGGGKFFSDAFAHGWTLVIALLAAGVVRTMTWRVFLGAGLAGCLADGAIVRLIGTPIAKALGPNSLAAGAVLVPLLEEFIKALLVVLIVWLASRRSDVRPSAVDITMLGMWVGAGFALYENAMYGRGGTDWGASPFSLLFPSEGKMPGGAQLSGGHLLFTGVVSLGLAITFLYRQRFRLARWAAPAAFVIAFAEHGAWNAKALGSGAGWVTLLQVITLDGYLSSILLIGGIATIIVLEWRRATRDQTVRPVPQVAPGQQAQVQIPRWVWLRTDDIARRGRRLAALQCAPPAPRQPITAQPYLAGGQS